MAEAGRILHHLANHIGDHKNCVLFVGFQGEHSLGRRIQAGAEPVKIFGQMVTRRAAVETMSGYSAHADKHALRTWVKALGGPITRAFVDHGETEAAAAMAIILKECGVGEVTIPRLGESFLL